MSKNKEFDDLVKDLASDSERWIYFKKAIEEEIKVYEDDIRAKKSFIKAVDEAVKKREGKIIKLN